MLETALKRVRMNRGELVFTTFITCRIIFEQLYFAFLRGGGKLEKSP